MNHQGRKRENRKGVVVIVDDRRVELSEISSQPDAKSISLWKLDHSSIDLSQIVTPTLEKLKLRNADLTHIDLSPLSICRELSTLEIDGNKGLMNLDLGPLSSCTKLSMLNVSMNSLKDIDLSPFKGHSGLAVLNVTMNDIEKMNLQALRECSNLQVLWLEYNPLDLREAPDGRGCISGIDFAGFDRLEKLRVITIGKIAHYFDTSITTDFVLDITDLVSCPNLRTFDYDYDDVTLLAHLPKYETRLPPVFKRWKDNIVWPGYR
ncbi:MAG: leucine-rich repeat domain-containing protein [Candidatus Thorarchaeota archaeon]|nr:MAG: leucine-rich repeat domain-containing protein [Candidatus Thorarchaeota archaeon]